LGKHAAQGPKLFFVGAMIPSLLILAGAAVSMADLTLPVLTPETTVAAAADLLE
jgi:hypothetical protein